MNKRNYSKTELGMMYGVVSGGAVAAILFALTGNALWFTAVGVGLAIGLGVGASMDRKTK